MSEHAEAMREAAAKVAEVGVLFLKGTIAENIRALPLPEPAVPAEIATVKKTVAGPFLFVSGVLTRPWNGAVHDKEADLLAADINAALAGRENVEIERLKAELFQTRNYWSDQFSRECNKARERDADLATAREAISTLESMAAGQSITYDAGFSEAKSAALAAIDAVKVTPT